MEIGFRVREFVRPLFNSESRRAAISVVGEAGVGQRVEAPGGRADTAPKFAGRPSLAVAVRRAPERGSCPDLARLRRRKRGGAEFRAAACRRPDEQPTEKLRVANVSHMIAFQNSQGQLMEQFSPEIMTMLGVGVAIIGLVLLQGRRLDRRLDSLALRMDEQYRHLTGQMDEQYRHLTGQMNEQYRHLTGQMNEQYRHLTDQMNEQFRQMDEQFQKLSERVARVEGKFDLLETFVEHRTEPPAKAVE